MKEFIFVLKILFCKIVFYADYSLEITIDIRRWKPLFRCYKRKGKK